MSPHFKHNIVLNVKIKEKEYKRMINIKLNVKNKR